eukprot:gb/GFBE01007536.1/.p1 GENE.gb/GFBE01007536.1/~~gb/GFBE01007536.1/.p1  ORF type:complete len:429 (+),score=72.76 gb/GFBE01007536.1/:1-1287(+)
MPPRFSSTKPEDQDVEDVAGEDDDQEQPDESDAMAVRAVDLFACSLVAETLGEACHSAASSLCPTPFCDGPSTPPTPCRGDVTADDLDASPISWPGLPEVCERDVSLQQLMSNEDADGELRDAALHASQHLDSPSGCHIDEDTADMSWSFAEDLLHSDDEDRRIEDDPDDDYRRRVDPANDSFEAEEEDCSLPMRPPAAGGRPHTRGLRGALLSQPPVAPSFVQSRGGDNVKVSRKVVYVDHHHAHHHHHFHEPTDWNGTPGDLPPDLLRRRQERSAEADVEQRSAPSGSVFDAGVSSEAGRKRGARLPPASQRPGARNFRSTSVRQGRAGRNKATPRRIDGAGKCSSVPPSNISSFSTSGTSMMASTFGGSSAFSTWGSKGLSTPMPQMSDKALGKSPVDLPLNQYFKLFSRLPMESRLLLSPYGAS